MGGKSDDQTTTTRTELDPASQKLLNLLSFETRDLADQTRGQKGDLVPDLSGDTLQGQDLLRNQFLNNPGSDLLNGTVNGDFLNANPFTAPTGTNGNKFAFLENGATGFNAQAGLSNPQSLNAFDGVSDAVSQQAIKTVGDRFSQAGRGGSGAEATALAGEVTRNLAPFAFDARSEQLGRQFQGRENQIGRLDAAGANQINRRFGANESRINRVTGARESLIGRQFGAGESANGRGFAGFESERLRQNNAIPQLFGMQGQEIQNLLNSGSLTEDQARRQALEPFERLGLLTGPIGTALNGGGSSTALTQPLNRNGFGNALGGATLGASLGKGAAIGGPFGALLGGAAGLLLG